MEPQKKNYSTTFPTLPFKINIHKSTQTKAKKKFNNTRHRPVAVGQYPTKTNKARLPRDSIRIDQHLGATCLNLEACAESPRWQDLFIAHGFERHNQTTPPQSHKQQQSKSFGTVALRCAFSLSHCSLPMSARLDWGGGVGGCNKNPKSIGCIFWHPMRRHGCVLILVPVLTRRVQVQPFTPFFESAKCSRMSGRTKIHITVIALPGIESNMQLQHNAPAPGLNYLYSTYVV